VGKEKRKIISRQQRGKKESVIVFFLVGKKDLHFCREIAGARKGGGHAFLVGEKVGGGKAA